MAFSVSVVEKTVLGNKNVVVLSCVADAASDSFRTGLPNVDFVQFTPRSMSTGASGGAKIKNNILTAGTAAPGYIAVTGITSGDHFYLTVFGH